MNQPRHEFETPSVANSRRARSRSLTRDDGGFTGAEKALVACLALALILTVTKIILGGAGTAAEHAKKVLEGQGDTQAWSVSEVNPDAASNEVIPPKSAATPTQPSAPVAAQTAPPKDERSFWEKVKQRGFWGNTWDLTAGTAVGLGNTLWGTLKLAAKAQPAVMVYESTRRMLNPDLARKEQEQNVALAKAIWKKPGILWDALTEDYANDVKEGRPFKAVGRVIGEFLPDLVLSKGLGKISKVNKIDKVITKGEHVESVLAKSSNHLDDVVTKVDNFEGAATKVDNVSEIAPKMLPAGEPGKVIVNALERHEVAFAEEIVRHRGGTLTGAMTRGEAGIDGFLGKVPISLKETQGGLSAVLKHASRAERQAAKAGYKEVELFIKAPNVGSRELLDFASKGPLSKIPGQGTINAINVLTRDGWIRIIR